MLLWSTPIKCRPHRPYRARRYPARSIAISMASSRSSSAWKRQSPAGPRPSLRSTLPSISVRDLRRNPAGAARGGPRRRRHLGHRAGRGGFPATGSVRVRAHRQALLQSVDQFTLLQGGGFDVAMLSVSGGVRGGDVNSYLRRGRTSPRASAASTTSSPGPQVSFSPRDTSPPAEKDIRIEDGELKIVTDCPDRQVRPRGRPDLVLRRDGPEAPPRRSYTSPNAASSS